MRPNLRQAVHIFRKDVRHLRYEIVVVLGLVVLFVVESMIDSREWWLGNRVLGNGPDTPGVLMLMGWAYLLARLIHDEALPGDRQFWLTRPYSRTSLLASKVLFAIVFINLPMLIADVILLRVNGFSPTRNLDGLVWKQALLTMTIVLLPFALAAITRRFGEFLLAALAVALVSLIATLYLTHDKRTRPELSEWIPYARVIAITVASAVLIVPIQYFRRRTLVSRGIALTGLALACVGYRLAPSSAELSLGVPRIDVSNLRVVARPCEKCTDVIEQRDGMVRLFLPIEISGIPRESVADIRGTDVEVLVSGRRYIRGWRGYNRARYGFVELYIPSFSAIKNQPISMNVKVLFAIISQRTIATVSRQDAPVFIPALGYCKLPGGGVICRAAFRWPRGSVSVRMGSDYWSFRPSDSSPFPADDPVSAFSTHVASGPAPMLGDWSSQAIFIIDAPAVSVERGFTLSNIRLADFEK